MSENLEKSRPQDSEILLKIEKLKQEQLQKGNKAFQDFLESVEIGKITQFDEQRVEECYQDLLVIANNTSDSEISNFFLLYPELKNGKIEKANDIEELQRGGNEKEVRTSLAESKEESFEVSKEALYAMSPGIRPFVNDQVEEFEAQMRRGKIEDPNLQQFVNYNNGKVTREQIESYVIAFNSEKVLGFVSQHSPEKLGEAKQIIESLKNGLRIPNLSVEGRQRREMEEFIDSRQIRGDRKDLGKFAASNFMDKGFRPDVVSGNTYGFKDRDGFGKELKFEGNGITLSDSLGNLRIERKNVKYTKTEYDVWKEDKIKTIDSFADGIVDRMFYSKKDGEQYNHGDFVKRINGVKDSKNLGVKIEGAKSILNDQLGILQGALQREIDNSKFSNEEYLMQFGTEEELKEGITKEKEKMNQEAEKILKEITTTQLKIEQLKMIELSLANPPEDRVKSFEVQEENIRNNLKFLSNLGFTEWRMDGVNKFKEALNAQMFTVGKENYIDFLRDDLNQNEEKRSVFIKALGKILGIPKEQLTMNNLDGMIVEKEGSKWREKMRDFFDSEKRKQMFTKTDLIISEFNKKEEKKTE